MKVVLASVAALALLTFVVPLSAGGPTLAADNLTGPDHPFCKKRDELQELQIAKAKNDQRWIRALKSCVLLQAGVKIEVIETVDSIARVRVFGPTGSSVGYSIP